MHAIAGHIISTQPEKTVRYVSSETFTNELIDALRTSNNISLINSFRHRYRSIDILLIDDIQFIIGKESTQEEFFHTFNELIAREKQIIISSDRPPKEFDTLDERLRTRFASGLLADIQMPDYETRMAILQKKAEMERYSINNEVFQYIATNIKSNIRELEGALTKLIALSRVENREITIELAEDALKEFISPDEKKEVTAELIINTVAEHFNIPVQDIKGSKRNSEIVQPRHIAMYLIRNMTNISLNSIGDVIGKRDHTTIMHGIEKIDNDIKQYEDILRTVDVLKKKINPSD
jgi:chromosomal replication initiator protein